MVVSAATYAHTFSSTSSAFASYPRFRARIAAFAFRMSRRMNGVVPEPSHFWVAAAVFVAAVATAETTAASIRIFAELFIFMMDLLIAVKLNRDTASSSMMVSSPYLATADVLIVPFVVWVSRYSAPGATTSGASAAVMPSPGDSQLMAPDVVTTRFGMTRLPMYRRSASVRNARDSRGVELANRLAVMLSPEIVFTEGG